MDIGTIVFIYPSSVELLGFIWQTTSWELIPGQGPVKPGQITVWSRTSQVIDNVTLRKNAKPVQGSYELHMQIILIIWRIGFYNFCMDLNRYISHHMLKTEGHTTDLTRSDPRPIWKKRSTERHNSANSSLLNVTSFFWKSRLRRMNSAYSLPRVTP